MSAEKKSIDGVTEVFLVGRMVHPHNEEMIDITEEFLNSSDDTLVLNFKDATFIDSAELGALLLVRIRIMDRQKKLILKDPSDFVAKVFDSYQFDKVFDIRKT